MYYGLHVNLVDRCREIVCNIGMTFSISLTLNQLFAFLLLQEEHLEDDTPIIICSVPYFFIIFTALM
jgi:hypothetical protein